MPYPKSRHPLHTPSQLSEVRAELKDSYTNKRKENIALQEQQGLKVPAPPKKLPPLSNILHTLTSLRRPIRILTTPSRPMHSIALILRTLPTRSLIIKPPAPHIPGTRPPHPIHGSITIILCKENTQLVLIGANRRQLFAVLRQQVVALVGHGVEVGAVARELCVGADVEVAGVGFGRGRGRRHVVGVDPRGEGDGVEVEGGVDFGWVAGEDLGDGGRDAGGGAVLLCGGEEGEECEEEDWEHGCVAVFGCVEMKGVIEH
jgi:hypothetical protein